jgi:anti-anti-sigma factor
MIANCETENEILKVKINDVRLDGQNSLFDFLVEQSAVTDKIEKIIFDFDKVNYINSLGIAEFISLMRYFSEKKPKLKFKYVNVDKKIAKIFKMIELNSIADVESR